MLHVSWGAFKCHTPSTPSTAATIKVTDDAPFDDVAIDELTDCMVKKLNFTDACRIRGIPRPVPYRCDVAVVSTLDRLFVERSLPAASVGMDQPMAKAISDGTEGCKVTAMTPDLQVQPRFEIAHAMEHGVVRKLRQSRLFEASFTHQDGHAFRKLHKRVVTLAIDESVDRFRQTHLSFVDGRLCITREKRSLSKDMTRPSRVVINHSERELPAHLARSRKLTRDSMAAASLRRDRRVSVLREIDGYASIEISDAMQAKCLRVDRKRERKAIVNEDESMECGFSSYDPLSSNKCQRTLDAATDF